MAIEKVNEAFSCCSIQVVCRACLNDWVFYVKVVAFSQIQLNKTLHSYFGYWMKKHGVLFVFIGSRRIKLVLFTVYYYGFYPLDLDIILL